MTSKFHVWKQVSLGWLKEKRLAIFFFDIFSSFFPREILFLCILLILIYSLSPILPWPGPSHVLREKQAKKKKRLLWNSHVTKNLGIPAWHCLALKINWSKNMKENRQKMKCRPSYPKRSEAKQSKNVQALPNGHTRFVKMERTFCDVSTTTNEPKSCSSGRAAIFLDC